MENENFANHFKIEDYGYGSTFCWKITNLIMNEVMELSNIYLIENDYSENQFSIEYHLNFSLIVSYELLENYIKNQNDDAFEKSIIIPLIID